MCFDEEPQRYPNVFPDKLLIYGRPTFDLQVCPLKRREQILDADLCLEPEQVSIEQSINELRGFRFKYNVSLAVQHNEVYTVFFPRLF